MNRREFVRNTMGALFGVSMIPAALEKPVFPKCNPAPAYIPYRLSGMDPSYLGGHGFLTTFHRDEATGVLQFIKSEKLPPNDISEATKIHLKEMWG